MAKDKKYGQVDLPGVPDDEPVFILRAQDKLAVGIIARYRNAAAMSEAPGSTPTQEWLDSIDGEGGVIEDFQAWQSANSDKVKFPD